MAIATRFLRAPGVRSDKRRDELTTSADEQRLRAERRYEIARTAFHMMEVGETIAAIRAHLRMKVRLGEMDAPVPSATSINELGNRWKAGETSQDDYADRPRSGRPHKVLDARLWRVVRDAILLADFGSRSELHRRIQARAVALGLPDPGRRAVVHALEQEHLRLVTSASDAAAAQRLAFFHPQVPFKKTHQCWVIDEFVFPVWVRIFLETTGTWVSAKLHVILIIDAGSRAVLCALLVDPTRRRDKTGKQMTSDFDHEDVLAAILSAACRDLAPEVTSEFAGYLPHVIRWDNAKQHFKLRDPLIHTLKIQVRKLPQRRPQNRGVVERPIGTLKSWFCHLKGFDERWHPADQLRTFTTDEMLKLAAGKGRVMQRQQDIAVMALMDLDEAQSALDDVVRRYDTEHKHRRLGGLTPAQAYRKYMPRDPRRGQDAIHLLPLQTAFVTRNGIEHRQNGWEKAFAPVVGNVALMPGHPVTFRADPLGRGIFAELFNARHFLKPMDLWSNETGPARIAELQAIATNLYEQQSREARQAESQQIHDDAGVPVAEPQSTRPKRVSTVSNAVPAPNAPEAQAPAAAASDTAAWDDGAPRAKPPVPPDAGTQRPNRRRFLAADPMAQVRPARAPADQQTEPNAAAPSDPAADLARPLAPPTEDHTH